MLSEGKGTEKRERLGSICGPSVPLIGSRVPMRRMLHDNGFGFCGLYVKGPFWVNEKRPYATFQAYPSKVWRPNEFGPRSLNWVEKRIKTWDAPYPDAHWLVVLIWPWQSEEWERQRPGRWVVVKAVYVS